MDVNERIARALAAALAECIAHSDRIANSTHLGIGSLPVSHRATVVRWTPRDAARPSCVSPARMRRVRRVSGDIANPFLSDGVQVLVGVNVNAGVEVFESGETININLDPEQPFVFVAHQSVVPAEREFLADGVDGGIWRDGDFECVGRGLHGVPSSGVVGAEAPGFLGSEAPMVRAPAGAFAVSAGGVDAGSGASLLFADDAVNCSAEKAMRAGCLESVAGGGGFVEGGPGRLAGEAGEEAVCCFHGQNVAPCYNTVNNLYQTRQKNVR